MAVETTAVHGRKTPGIQIVGRLCQPPGSNIALRNEESINDEVLRRIQRDIDLAEARHQGRR